MGVKDKKYQIMLPTQIPEKGNLFHIKKIKFGTDVSFLKKIVSCKKWSSILLIHQVLSTMERHLLHDKETLKHVSKYGQYLLLYRYHEFYL